MTVGFRGEGFPEEVTEELEGEEVIQWSRRKDTGRCMQSGGPGKREGGRAAGGEAGGRLGGGQVGQEARRSAGRPLGPGHRFDLDHVPLMGWGRQKLFGDIVRKNEVTGQEIS